MEKHETLSLAMSLSRVSLGRISLVLLLMQQGVSLGGSAGANTQPLKALCVSTGSAGSVPLVVALGTGSRSRVSGSGGTEHGENMKPQIQGNRENMKPFEGKHETFLRCRSCLVKCSDGNDILFY